MSSSKHDNSGVFDKAYEENEIGIKGIAYFGIGLFLLIVITFGLMWVLKDVLEDNAKETKSMEAIDNPMAMNEKERLPPEPRLQVAPGFKVDGPNGPINLELRAPQSEYWELEKIWKKEWDEGMKDPKTGAITSMPIEEAKEMVLAQGLKAKSGPDAEKLYTDSKLRFSDASAGRAATDRRR